MFLEKSYSAWEITQTGSAAFNLTLIGNDFDANDQQFLKISLGEQGSLNLIANSASNFSDPGCGEANSPLPDKITDPSVSATRSTRSIRPSWLGLPFVGLSAWMACADVAGA
jgi:hypothetical protein